MSNGKRKIFVLDTSVLMHDPCACLAFKEHDVILPVVVLEELDKLKAHPYKGERAREVSRELQRIRSRGNFNQGITTPGGGKIRVDLDGDDSKKLPNGFIPDKADNIIILTALRLKNDHNDSEVVLVTKDTIMAVKADSLGIKTEDFQSDKVPEVDTLYTGFREIVVRSESLRTIHQGNKVVLATDACVDSSILSALQPNLCCRLFDEDDRKKFALAIYKHDGGLFHLVGKPDLVKKEGEIHPRNDEQAFALRLAMDPTIRIVTLSGSAGTGKSLIAILAGWKLINEKSPFANKLPNPDQFKPKKLIIFRPTYEIGNGLGFLPGTIDEKFAPWQRPAISNLRLVAEEAEKNNSEESEKDSQLGKLMNSGIIEILPINFIRGDTLHHALIIVDDAQNMTPHEMKAIITRVGEGSKIIINGDMRQVDVSFLGPDSNGLAHVIAKCVPQKWDRYAHLQLVKGERSEVAEFAAKIL